MLAHCYASNSVTSDADVDSSKWTRAGISFLNSSGIFHMLARSVWQAVCNLISAFAFIFMDEVKKSSNCNYLYNRPILSQNNLEFYLFVVCLMTQCQQLRLYSVGRNKRWMINWKIRGRKRPWPNSRYYPEIILEGLRKTGLRAEIWTLELPNTKQETLYW
jgi:hypothetical protein